MSFHLDEASFRTLREHYDVVPVVRELSADTITPVSAFAAVASEPGEAFLLESVERGEMVGRYSFLGFGPRRRLAIRRGAANPIAMLREELVPLRVAFESELPPFFGGAVGWFGYGAAAWSESLPDRHGKEGEIDAELLFFDRVVAFDHVRQRLYAVANVFADDPRTSADLYADATSAVESMVRALKGAKTDLTPFAEPDQLEFRSSVTPERYMDGVRKAKELIAAGEAFQIVLSQRWSAQFSEEGALALYRVLRSVNPSPYMFLLRTHTVTLVGASPEMLVRVNNRLVETRPIAGTRRRGANPVEDAQLERELLADEKENAEHLMLVDLGRNDVGRVCASGSVQVAEYGHVERYSHVMHLVSDVSGTLREGLGPIDAFLSAFPAGTVSGAPKIRAMEIIDEIESIRRGVYAGAVMYAGFSGNLDSCIAIRTVVLRDGEAHVQAGAGIVHDSVPEREHEECVNKAAALKRAVAIAASNRSRAAAGVAG